MAVALSVRERLDQLLGRRIAIFDGSVGVLIQRKGLTEEDFRGERFRNHPKLLRNDVDILCLTQPDVVTQVHEEYLKAGADFLTTNTFTATPISQADYGLQDLVYEINVAGARLARAAADRYENRFVAGSLGPTNVTLSLSPKVDDPSYREITFDQLRDGYAEAARGLRDGGADFLLIETIFDTLNGKAAIAAVKEVAPDLPVFLSVTIVDRSGRNLSGQTVEAFWTSVEHADPFAVGINCSLGATEMRPYIAALSRVAPVYVTCYPNAGLPNAMGGYDERPNDTSRLLREFADSGFLNAAGGCCGTTPDHIRRIREVMEGVKPRQIPEVGAHTRFSGLEPFEIGPGTIFTTIGERTNVTGSKRFRRLIESDDFTGAVQVALDQVRGGANLLDVNMDADLLDSEVAMTRFLNLIATEPEIARIPIMVDSSKWSVLEAGLKCLQGKGVCNSISLKEGEESFLEKAMKVRAYGAAAVVMAFDEKGQADTFERKVSICERAYKLLVEKAGYRPEDIVFDPNILAIATGIEEHNGYAKAFIEATREIKKRLPGVRVSGGVSNLSFSFRGNDRVREEIGRAHV
jgi:5-methyltetrahydrofolate--homocysteine methyltransferase